MNKRVLSFDLIRTFAILGVVATHTEAITASTTNYLGGISWWLANTLHSLAAVSIPLFVMLTGALVLTKAKISWGYIGPKIVRLFIIPLLFWWPLYYWWTTIRPGGSFQLVDLVRRFFIVDIGHLYYLPVVIGLYLILPFLSTRLHKMQKKHFPLLLGVVTSVVLIYRHLSFFVFRSTSSTNIALIFLPYLMYLLWGFFLSGIRISRKACFILLEIAIILIGLSSLLTYQNTLAYNLGNRFFWTNGGGNFFWDPFTVPLLILSATVFLLLMNIEIVLPTIFRSRWLKNSLVVISSASFGIYLIHPIVMEVLDNWLRISIQFISYPLWIWYFQRTTLVFLASAGLSILAIKIPVIRNVFGARN